jgi:phosphoglycolate phosphatase
MSGPAAEKRRFASVVFDFDYTLADSSLGVIECVNYAFLRMGLPACSPEAVRATIGISLVESYKGLAGDAGGDRFDEFERLFVKRGDEVMLQGVRLLDPVRPATETLLAGGISLGIVSSKYRRRIEAVLKRDRLAHAFAAVVGSDDVAAQKPDPSGLLAAIGKLGRAPQDVLYVGDSTVDAEAARRAGVLFAAVLTGVTPREAFAAYEPRAVLEDLTLLPGLVL